MKFVFALALLAAVVTLACNDNPRRAPATATLSPPTTVTPVIAFATVTGAGIEPEPSPFVSRVSRAGPALTATPDPAGSSICLPSSKTQGVNAFRLDDERCWMVWDLGASGGTISSQKLYGSDDGGQHWSLLAQYGFVDTLTTPVANFGVLPGPKITVLLFLDSQNGWIGTNEPGATVYSTDDGGRTWAAAAIDHPTSVRAIDCADIDNCTVTMSLSKWTTTNGGETWLPAP